jgi:CDP-glycerol glycerophosphotransferase (TagB/SpsB family)
MPTWRGLISSGTNRESTTDFPIIDILNIDKLNDYLQNNNNLLIIKPHPIQISLDIFDNIKIITDFDLNSRDIFLYELFNEVDALLTDYSSVYFDFLLTQKPIGFTIDDFDSYEDKRGFVVNNPLEIMPGSKIRTFMELITFLKDLNNECDNYSEERKNINNLVNKYHDKNSTQRILERFGIGN